VGGERRPLRAQADPVARAHRDRVGGEDVRRRRVVDPDDLDAGPRYVDRQVDVGAGDAGRGELPHDDARVGARVGDRRQGDVRLLVGEVARADVRGDAELAVERGGRVVADDGEVRVEAAQL